MTTLDLKASASSTTPVSHRKSSLMSMLSRTMNLSITDFGRMLSPPLTMWKALSW